MKGAKRKRNHNPRKRKRQPGDTLRFTSKKVKKSQYFNVSWDSGRRQWLARKVFRKEVVINKHYDHEDLAALAVNWACEEVDDLEPPNTKLANLCSAVVCKGGCKHEDSTSWVRCQKCEMWFHAECTKLSEARLKMPNPNYRCSMCIGGEPSWHNSKKLIGETVSPTVSSDEEMDSGAQDEFGAMAPSDPPANELEPIESELEEGNSDPPANSPAPISDDAPRRPVQLLDVQSNRSVMCEGKNDSPEDDSEATLPEPSPPAPPRDPQMPPLEAPDELQEGEEEQPAVLSAPPARSVRPLRQVREVIDLSESPRMRPPQRVVLRKSGNVRSHSGDGKGNEEAASSSGGAAAAQGTIQEEEASDMDAGPTAPEPIPNTIEEPQSVQNIVEENLSVQNIEQPRNPAPQQYAFNEEDVVAWAKQLDEISLIRVTAKVNKALFEMLSSMQQPIE